MQRTLSDLNSILYVLNERHTAPLVKYTWHVRLDFEPR